MKKFILLSAAFLCAVLSAESAPQKSAPKNTPAVPQNAPEPPKDTYDMELNRGRTALIQRQFAQAEEYFSKAEKLANYPWQRTRLRYCRAASLALQKKYNEAIKLLKAKVPPNQRSVYHTAYCAMMCGEYAAAAGKIKQAENEWKAALDAAPHNWIESRAMLRLGQAAEQRKDYKTAYMWYDRMKKRIYALPAARSRGYMMTAMLHAKRKMLDEAYAELTAAEKIHQLRPDMLAEIAMLRADLLTMQSRHQESHAEILRALKIPNLTQPAQVQLLCRSAKAELQFKHYRAAYNTIRRAKNLRYGQQFFDKQLEKEIEKACFDFQKKNKNTRKK